MNGVDSLPRETAASSCDTSTSFAAHTSPLKGLQAAKLVETFEPLEPSFVSVSVFTVRA
jgi:hypothetical protein